MPERYANTVPFYKAGRTHNIAPAQFSVNFMTSNVHDRIYTGISYTTRQCNYLDTNRYTAIVKK